MSTGASCIVEQFGLAMMPSCQAASSGFTWLTMSGTVGSIRQADELSMTVAPRVAATGAASAGVAAGREDGDVGRRTPRRPPTS
jgi:hypothetical protein